MSHISNMCHADANPCVESSALVYKLELAVKNTVGAQKGAKIDLEDVIVLKVNAKAGNVLVLQLDANVTPMFAEIAGLAVVMVH